MIKKCLCAAALVAALPAAAAGDSDQFTYVSGGLLFNQHGYSSESNKNIETAVTEDALGFDKDQLGKLKSSACGMGVYLNGSVGFDNNVFVEGRLQNSQHISDYLLGVGYHYPVMQSIDIYGLVGVSKRHMQVASSKATYSLQSVVGYKAALDVLKGENPVDAPAVTKLKNDFITGAEESRFVTNYHGKFSPTAEIGLKAKITDDAGVDIAYRFARFGDKKVFDKKNLERGETGIKTKTALHEVHLGGYQKITDNLAVEARYTYTTYLKGKDDFSKKDDAAKCRKDHVGSVGLRYTF